MKLNGLFSLLIVFILCAHAARAAESASWLNLAQEAAHALDKQDEQAALRYNLAALTELEKMAKMHQHINAVKPNRDFMRLHSLMLNLTYVYDKQIMDLSMKRLDDIRSGSNTNINEINEAIAHAKERLRKQREAAYDMKLTAEQRMDAMHQISQQIDKETEETRAAYKKAQALSNQAKLPTIEQMMSAQKQTAYLYTRLAAAYSVLLGSNHQLTIYALNNKKRAEDDYTKYEKEYQDMEAGR